ncbi:MAG: DGQHR domain-containing protein [Anaerohalosphaera sp.]|nr:DGQHR domain-containing protein [Anaerohalosphaera sp.]
MSDLLTPLITDEDEIRREITRRKKVYFEKSITASSSELLQQKAELEEQDGWHILRKNNKSYRLKKDKPLSEKLEDTLWVTVARMGFDELSQGRNFTIDLQNGTTPRQIDVFAKDRESVILIECTTCEKLQRKKMSSLIEKISSIKSPVAKAINAHYGKKPKLKIKWAIATLNVEWSNPDLEKAAAANIIVLRDTETNYYRRLTDHLKGAAKYQFLSDLFTDESIPGLELKVPATKGMMGKRVFYNFLIRPSELLKIAHVSHKASRDIEDLNTYQRMLRPKRLNDIASYVDKGGQFPTNIVINIRSKKRPRFDCMDKIGNSAFGTLYLPNRYASCIIIDGQHRLYGYAHSEHATKKNDKTTLPVLAYDNLSATEEANLFVDINCEQVRVRKNLLNELYANLRWDSSDFAEKVDALCTRSVIGMNMLSSSPFCDRIIVSNRDKTHHRCLTLTSFNDGIRNERFFGTEKKPGPLMDSRKTSLEHTKSKATKVLLDFFMMFSDAIPEHWALGDEKGGYLCTNNGIRALLMVLSEILRHIAVRDSIDIDMLGAEDIRPRVAELAQPLINLFVTATPEEVDQFRSKQALKGVRRNALIMLNVIHKEIKEFFPSCLIEYLDIIDEEGTKEAHRIIDKLQGNLFTYVFNVLKKHFTDRDGDWWTKGIPPKTRVDCQARCELEGRDKNPEQYLLLINYRDIALLNWDLFSSLFDLGEARGKNKTTHWVVELNTIRNVTHHVEKWPATKKQVKRVREINAKLTDKFEKINSQDPTIS